MAVRRSEWGPAVGILARRRPEALSKPMMVSAGLHLFCFALVILSQVLSKLNRPDYQSFQVNLVASGVGPVSPGRIAQQRVRRSSKKKTPSPGKIKKPVLPVSPKKKLTSTSPTTSQVALPKRRVPRVQSPVPKEKAPVKLPPTVQDDPERLEEWWKKQSQSMKTPRAKATIKERNLVSPRRRTAKIDILRKSVVVPPAVPISKLSPKKNDPPVSKPVSPTRSAGHNPEAESPESKGLTPETSTSVNEGLGNEMAPDQEVPTETASLGPARRDGLIESSGGASTGDTRFAFPGYLQRIDTKIRWQWAPTSTEPDEASVVVRFDIKKNGNIDKMSVVVEESSGNPFFDLSAMRAVTAAHPFPPLPNAYADQILTVYMHFIVQEVS